jgi:REP element-mobilizing transposase RayT
METPRLAATLFWSPKRSGKPTQRRQFRRARDAVDLTKIHPSAEDRILTYAVGGVEDHVHCATVLPRTLTIADLVEKLKVSSSAWVKKHLPNGQDFYWQRGYGAFSVGASGKDALMSYVNNQAEHHRTTTFQEEYRKLLTKYGITWDERYVWD